MKLYYIFKYDRSLKTRWLAKELNLKLEEIMLDAEKKEHLTAPFIEINPHGMVPTLVKDDGEVLYESAVITLDLCKTYQPDLIDDTNEFTKWLFYFSASFDQLSGAIIASSVFNVHESIRELAEKRLPHRLQALEQYIEDKTYWYQDRFTLLDIFAWQNLAYLFQDGQLIPFPNLKRYVEEMATRPALASFSPNNLLYPASASVA